LTRLRITTAGESHGPAEVCVVEGMPAGVRLDASTIDTDLARRQGGYGRGGRMSIERDRCRFLSGVRHGLTIGSPVTIVVENTDFANWGIAMSAAAPAVSRVSAADLRPVAVPRPGHADLAGSSKYDFPEARNVLERASARETVGRVAGGAVCKRLLDEVGVSVRARVVSIGAVHCTSRADFADAGSIDWQAVEESPVGCDDSVAGEAMCRAIDQAREQGESLGGVFEVWCLGLCPGVGGYDRMDSRLDGLLLGALSSIQAIKGVEMGNAFSNAGRPGSQVHDAFEVKEQDGRRWIARTSNRAAGTEGGMSSGMPVVIRAAMKPIPTLTTPLPSVDLHQLTPTLAHVERSDVCAVPAARVVGEAMAAYVLAQCYLEKFGGDALADFVGSVQAYEARLEGRGLWRRY
jgi:chorismate synthase